MAKTPADIDSIKWRSIVAFAVRNLEPPKLNNRALNEVSQYYFANLARLNVMMLLPSLVGDLTSQIQRSFDIAETAIAGELQTEALDFLTHPRESEIAEMALKIYNDHAIRQKDALNAPDGYVRVIQRVDRGTRPVILLSDSTGVDSLNAMLASFVTGSWTAFETMAGDLWEAAINEHPRGLAELKGKRSRIEKKESEQPHDDPSGETSKTVSLNELLRHDYKIHNKMGTVLRADRRFDSLSRIREAFAIAFHKKATDVDSALQSLALDRLSEIRNLIVHKSGKIDQRFLQKADHLGLPKGAIGEQVRVDGNNLPSILGQVAVASTNLIKAVDSWIATN